VKKKTAPARGAWMALIAALLGWMFDGAEMGVFSMVAKPALESLLIAEVAPSQTRLRDTKGLSPEAAEELKQKVISWQGLIQAAFLIGAATGGVLFGWLGDRVGRVRAMTLSVLTYALFTGLCGFAGSAWQLGLLRFIAALGMGGEWSLGVALVMEVWPNRSRALMAGLIGAAANVGYFLVGIMGLILAALIGKLIALLESTGMSEDNVQWLTDFSGWRILMMLGVAPALLTFLIRMFVPESHKWEDAQKAGGTKHWASADLLVVILGIAGPWFIVYLWTADLDTHSLPLPLLAIRIVGTLLGLAVVCFGFTFPVLRYLQREAKESGNRRVVSSTIGIMLFAAVLSGIPLLGTWGTTQQLSTFAANLPHPASSSAEQIVVVQRTIKEWTQIASSLGAITGTILAAMLGDALGRRTSYLLLCASSLLSVLGLFLFNREFTTSFYAWTFIVGLTTASFYGWLPLYLPELFRTSVRATGQGFSFNFGRIVAAIGVLQLGNLRALFAERGIELGPIQIPAGLASACMLLSSVYVIGMVLILFAPETKGKPLPQ
jgi:SHS family sialic acid transporter-like MFS transporter